MFRQVFCLLKLSKLILNCIKFNKFENDSIGCLILTLISKYLANCKKYEKMFQTKVVGFKRILKLSTEHHFIFLKPFRFLI